MSDLKNQCLQAQKETCFSSGSEQDDEAANFKPMKRNISQSQSLNLRPRPIAYTDALKSRSQAPFAVEQLRPETFHKQSVSQTSSHKYQSLACPGATFTKINLGDMRNVSTHEDVNVTRSVSNLAGRRFNKLVAQMPGDLFSSSCNVLEDRLKMASTSEAKSPNKGFSVNKESAAGVELSKMPSTSDHETGSRGDYAETEIPTELVAALNKRLYPVLLNTYKEYTSAFGKKDPLTLQAKQKLNAMSKWVEGPTCPVMNMYS